MLDLTQPLAMGLLLLVLVALLLLVLVLQLSAYSTQPNPRSCYDFAFEFLNFSAAVFIRRSQNTQVIFPLEKPYAPPMRHIIILKVRVRNKRSCNVLLAERFRLPPLLPRRTHSGLAVHACVVWSFSPAFLACVCVRVRVCAGEPRPRGCGAEVLWQGATCLQRAGQGLQL